MSKIKMLTGQSFGRLLVIAFDRMDGHNGARWLCLCKCGNTVSVVSAQLSFGSTKSCGCLSRDLLASYRTKHGKNGTPEYAAYRQARTRCQNVNGHAYKNYGGRGIEFRFESFEQFYAELGDRPSPKHSLDRIDVNGHYEPGNVRWATAIEQSTNRRDRNLIHFRNESKTLAAWARDLGLDYGMLSSRFRYGWTVERAFTEPSRLVSK